MPQLGQSIQGKRQRYTIERVLVEGRFGATYLAACADGDPPQVILKTITLPSTPGWEAMEAFERDGERLRQLSHPHIARYLDSVVLTQDHPSDTRAHLGLVQELVDGQSLKARLASRGVSSIEESLPWFEAMLGTLTHMHELPHPLVHGDIDPGNIIIRSSDNQPVLVDFATVRQALLDAPTLASGLARGALDYAPMEQLLGLIFPASDLYALAMSFLTVVSGQLPSQFPIREGMRIDVPELLGAGASDQLAILLKQMTEPDPAYRLNNARIALERVRAQRHHADHPSISTRSDAPLTASTSSRTSDTPARKKPTQSPAQIMAALVRQSSDNLDSLEEDDCWSAPDLSNLARIHAFGSNLDGTHMVAARGNDAYILEGSDLQVRGELDFQEAAQRVAISRDGKRIAILTGFERLLFYDVEVSIWMRHEIIVEGMWPGNSQLTFSPQGDLVAISDDDQVNVYQWDDARMVERYDIDGQFGLEFEPNGELIFAVGASQTTIIDGARRHILPLTGATFSPDGTLLATSTGNIIQFGTFQGLTPSISWAHKEITIPEARGLNLTMLTFSPNQRYLAVASRDGFFRVIDVAQGRLLHFDDHRANLREHVKLFYIGFSSTSEQLLVHATLPPDELGSDPLGCLTSYQLPQGKFLGSMLWIDDSLSLLSAQGFYGEVAELSSGSFSTHTWERPELALDAFQGRDAEKRLSRAERALLYEFHQRREGIQQLWESEDRAWDLHAMINATAGIIHVLPAVWERADQQSERVENRGYSLFEQTREGYLLNAAQEISDMRDEDLRAMHKELLNAQGYERPNHGHEELHDQPDESLYTAPAQLTPLRRSDMTTRDDDLEEIRRRRQQDVQSMNRRSALSKPLTPESQEALAPIAEEPASGPSPKLMAVILSFCLAAGLIYSVIFFIGTSRITTDVLLGAVVAWPGLGIALYFSTVRRFLT